MADDKKTQKKVDQQLEEVRQQLDELKQQLEEKDQKYMRALADYQNLQRRTQADQQRFVKIATVSCLSNILVPLDHLMRAQEHLKDKGIEMIIKQFQLALDQEGVQEIEAVGKPFDPQTMEAVEKVEGEENIVMAVQDKGYTVHGMLLRPAKVMVGAGDSIQS